MASAGAAPSEVRTKVSALISVPSQAGTNTRSSNAPGVPRRARSVSFRTRGRAATVADVGGAAVGAGRGLEAKICASAVPPV